MPVYPIYNSTVRFIQFTLGKAMSRGWGFINTKCAPWLRVNDKFGERIAAGEKSKVSSRRCPGSRRYLSGGRYLSAWLALLCSRLTKCLHEVSWMDRN